MTMTLGREPPQLLKQRLFYRGASLILTTPAYPIRLKETGNVRHPGGALAVPVAPEGNQLRAAVSLCCSRADFRISGWYCGAE